MKLTDILSQLPKLSQEELATVRAAVEHLLAGSSDAEDPTRPLYDVVSGAVGRGYLSFQEFSKMAAYKTWRRDAPAVVQFIETAFPQSHKVTKLAIMNYLVSALIDDLKERNVPITLRTITNNISRLPQILDDCFPDYLKGGAAHLIVKAMERR